MYVSHTVMLKQRQGDGALASRDSESILEKVGKNNNLKPHRDLSEAALKKRTQLVFSSNRNHKQHTYKKTYSFI